MKIKSQRDFFAGLMFMVVGIVFAVGASNYPVGSSNQPGAGYFPLLLSVTLSVLGAIVLFKSLTIETESGDPIGPVAWRPLLVIVIAISVFGLSIDRLGLIVTVPLLIAIASLASSDVRWLGVLVNALVLTFASWILFVRGLKLAIPLWPWFVGG